MFKRIVALLIAVPVGALVIALSVANRQDMTLLVPPSVDGTPLASLTLPVFVVLFATLFVGMVLGSIATWFGQRRYRRNAREMKVEATKASFEAQRQKERAETLSREVVAASEKDAATAADRRVAAFASLGLPAPDRSRAVA